MPQTATNGATRMTPKAYVAHCEDQMRIAVQDREDLLNLLGEAHARVHLWGINTQEAREELEAEESAQLLAEALGVRRSGPLVEFEGDFFDEVAAL
jgi:hypothetical protein